MIALISLELHKLIHKKSFYICLLFALGYCIFVYISKVDPFGRQLHIVAEDGTIQNGRSAISLEKEMTDQYKGVLTDETVRKMYYELLERETAVQTDFGQSASSSYQERFLKQFFLPYDSIEIYVDGEMQSMEAQFDEEQLIKIGDRFSEAAMPLIFGYSAPWSGMLQSMIMSMFVLNLLVIVAISPIFSEEHTFKMNALLFTARYGRGKCCIAKITAAYLTGLVLSLFVILMHVLVTLLFFGGEGLKCSVQLSEPFLYQYLDYFKTVGGAIGDAIWLYTADVFFTVSLTILASVLATNVLTGTVLSLTFFVSPYLLLGIIREIRIKLIAPINHTTNFADILSLSPLAVGSVRIQYSYVITGILILCSVCFTAGTVKIYKNMEAD